MLYFAAHHLDADGGMMIIGSHNPPEYNGIKMVKANRPFFGDDIQALGRMVRAADFAEGKGTIEDRQVADAYVERLARDMQPGKALESRGIPATAPPVPCCANSAPACRAVTS